MTWLSIVLSWFPALVMLLAVLAFAWCCDRPSISSFIALLSALYVFPLGVYWLHHFFYPLKEGIGYLQSDRYSPWWGSHQIQVIYIAFPALETVLRLIPGAFSLWLKLWGSHIGKRVYWTPSLEISDRSLLEIGDGAVFGHGIGIYAHVVKPKKNDLMLYVKKVKIGAGAFIGAGCHLGPGVQVADNACVPAATDLYPNRKWAKEEPKKER